MRSRDRFDYNSLDSYRGLDRHSGSGLSTSYMAGHRDRGYNHNTSGSTEYHLGDGRGYGGTRLEGGYNQSGHDYDSRYQPQHYGNSRGGNYESYERNRPHNQYGSQSRDWANRGGLTRDYNHVGGSDTGYSQGSGPGYYNSHDRYQPHGNYRGESAYGDRDFYGDRNSRYNPGSSFSQGQDYGHSRDWSDRASDEVRSWFGDDEASRRRRDDDREPYSNRNYNGGYASYRNDF